MKKIHSMLRVNVVSGTLGRGRRFTVKRQQRAFAQKRLQGWVTNLPPVGPPFERVAFVAAWDPLSEVVQAVRNGTQVFTVTDLQRRLSAHPFQSDGLGRLSSAGLGLVAVDGHVVRLRPADPRAARLVNLARTGVSRKGFLDRTVIEAFLAVRDPVRQRSNVTDDRRLMAAEILATDWEIDCDDLLDARRYVRLVSRWFLPQTPCTPQLKLKTA